MQKYIYLLVPFTSVLISQLIKFILESFKYKKLAWSRLFGGSAGMPSSHTSFTFSLAMIILLTLGIDSPIFAITFIFALIVAYDSMGVRMESGKQAVAINTIVDEIFTVNPKLSIARLKEQLGHKPLEVLVGMFVGIIVSLGYYYILF